MNASICLDGACPRDVSSGFRRLEAKQFFAVLKPYRWASGQKVAPGTGGGSDHGSLGAACACEAPSPALEAGTSGGQDDGTGSRRGMSDPCVDVASSSLAPHCAAVPAFVSGEELPLAEVEVPHNSW